MTHPVFTQNATAVVTGGADGIGLACASRFAGFGMNLVVADLGEERLSAAVDTLKQAGAGEAVGVECDVSDRKQVEALKFMVDSDFGGADLVMNNAAVQPGSDLFDTTATWQRILSVNLFGILNGTQVFAPDMARRDRPGAIVNTGSKQGITSPPGDPAYNVAKSGVKTLTELLAHELRNTAPHLTAHLLIPGFVFTRLTRPEGGEKPEGAWWPDQVADALIDGMNANDFYILCPDNDVPRALDQKRMAWAMGDVIENRPPLSRWHPDFADAFAAFADES